MTEHAKLTYKEAGMFAIVSGFGGCLNDLYLPKKMAKELVHRWNSHDALLTACRHALEFIGRNSKTDWNNEITPVLEQAIAEAEK